MPNQKPLRHPVSPLRYRQALVYLERFIRDEILTEKQRCDGVEVVIVDYIERNPKGRGRRPWCGIRVAELDFRCAAGGSAFAHYDLPDGLAVCAQVERCLLALVEGWNSGPENGTDEEIERLRYLVNLTGEIERANTARYSGYLRVIVDHDRGVDPARRVRAAFLADGELAHTLAIDDDPETLEHITAAIDDGIAYHDRHGEEDVYVIRAADVSTAPPPPALAPTEETT